MLPPITREGMIEVDRIMEHELDIPVELMMEHAGINLARLTLEIATRESRGQILVIAGSGNNGGGGMVCARRLRSWGRKVTIWLPKGEPTREVPKKQLQRAKETGVHVEFEPNNSNNHLVVDAYIGYNFKGTLNGISKEVAEYMQNHSVISLDIPTGIDSNSGINHGNINPLATMTLAWPKTGMIGLHSNDIGRAYLADISIPSWIFNQPHLYGEVDTPSQTDIQRIYQLFQKRSVIEIQIHEQGWDVK